MQPWKLKVSELRDLFSLWPNGKVAWLVANWATVVFASPGAEQKLGLGFGQPVVDQPLLRKVLMSKRPIVEQHQTWHEGKLISTAVVAIPVEGDHVDEGAVLLYGVENSPAVEKIDGITALIQEMNGQKNPAAALQIFVSQCKVLLGCQMAGIWVKRPEGYYLLAKSAEDPVDEGLLSKLNVADMLNNNKDANIEWWTAQPRQVEEQSPDGLASVLQDQLDQPGYKHVLSFPLRHMEEDLGILGLFTSDPRAFDGSSMLWLNLLGPLLGSLVYEHEMRSAALEREQDLNLLLWGTEILVQIESETELLAEAGEMAMVLNLEAGLFFMQAGDGWHVHAPFGRLKQNDSGWERWIFNQMEIDPVNYAGHDQPVVHVLKPAWSGLEADFPWRKLLIQPVVTHNGVIGELWLLDFVDAKLERRQEVFAAFARGLGVALVTIRQRRKLEQMATTDALTGILNRQGFDQRFRIEAAATKRRASTFLFLLMDLDGFKNLNDTQGHPVGDQALCTVASNLESTIREYDIVARTGGDEFTLVLSDLHKGPEAMRVIERIKQRMGLAQYSLGISIGVAEFPTETDDFEQLYHLADQRLYYGKRSGKGQIVFDRE